MDASVKKQIRNFITVLLSGILCGFALLFYFVIYHSPTGLYLAKNVIIAPEVLQKLQAQNKNPKKGNGSDFVFQKVEFAYYDLSSKEIKRITLDENQYKQFYDLIVNDQSVAEVNETLPALFSQETPLQIVLSMKAESTKADSTKPFQIIQIISDYYRVELHEDKPTSAWVYYYHPGIQEAILRLFVP